MERSVLPTWSTIVYEEVVPEHSARKSSPLKFMIVEPDVTSHPVVDPSPLLQIE